MNIHKLGFPDSEQFHIKEINNFILIHRKEIGVKWNDTNKYFRSSVWDKDTGELVSAGFKAFTNLGEQPAFESIDEFTDINLYRKLDGSCLIVSKYKGELIVRTRGTIDASKLENGYEIELLKLKYPNAFDNKLLDQENYTLLYEWTTPTNRIVLNESVEPELWLIGIVQHYGHKGTDDYSYLSQVSVTAYSKIFGVRRPEQYKADIKGISEYLKDNKTIEGVVIYANRDQYLKKIKTPHYLYLHRIFTGVKTVDHLLEFFIAEGQPTRQQFEEYLGKTFDWEVITTLKPILDELYTLWNNILDKISTIKEFVSKPEFKILTRKEQAQIILQKYEAWSKIAFETLDNKQHNTLKLFEIAQRTNK